MQWRGGKAGGKGCGKRQHVDVAAVAAKAASAAVSAALSNKQGNVQAADGEGFQCLHCDCKAAQRAWLTHKGRDRCFICGRPKGEAVAPRKDLMVSWAREHAEKGRLTHTANERGAPGQGKSRMARARRSAAAAAAKDPKASQGESRSYAEVVAEEAQARIPVTTPSRQLDMATVHEAVKDMKIAERKVGFAEEQISSFKMIAPALLEVMESLQKERRPAALRTEKDPRDTANAFIRDSKPVTKGLDLVKAEEELAKLQSAQLLFAEGHPLHTAVTLQLNEAQAAVTRLEKDCPSPDLRASCLEEIVAAYRRAVRARKDRAHKGREAAAERRAKRAELVRQARTELDAFEDALETLEDSVQSDYDELARDLDDYDEEVLAQIQEKVGSEGPMLTMSLDKPPDPVIEQLRREKLAIAEKMRKMEEKIAAAEAEATAAKAAQEATRAAAETAATGAQAAGPKGQHHPQTTAEQAAWKKECERVANVPMNPKELPEVDGISDDDLLKLAKTHSLLQRYALHHAEVSLTFQDTGLTADLLHALLGPIYLRVYGDGNGGLRQVPQRMPTRILNLLAIALAKLSSKIAKINASQLQAAEGAADEEFTAILEATDNRTQPY